VPFGAAHAKLQTSDGWRICVMSRGHDAMVDMPDRLTKILLQEGELFDCCPCWST